MDQELLKELARYQSWADGEHWKALHSNTTLLQDSEILKRLNHIHNACAMLTTLARGGKPDFAGMKDRESVEEIESAMVKATGELSRAIESVDLAQIVTLPRGPNGPFDAPAGVLLLQAIMHGHHHRGQNASRMRELGVSPPITDYVVWFARGRP